MKQLLLILCLFISYKTSDKNNNITIEKTFANNLNVNKERTKSNNPYKKEKKIITNIKINETMNRGLFYTPEEVTVWKSRWNKGPYWSKNDVVPNSPDDGQRILRNANKFVAAPLSEHWKAPSGDGCVPQWSAEPHSQGFMLKDCGFTYLMTGDKKYLDAVKKALLAQVDDPLTDFSNTKRWCDRVFWDINPSFIYTEWLSRLAFGYDCIRFDINEAEKTKINTWFLNAGRFWMRNLDTSQNQLFENANRAAGKLSSYSLDAIKTKSSIPYVGGKPISNLAKMYNNRKSNHARFGAIIGCMLNDTELKKSAAFYFKEHIRYSTWADGHAGDFERWTNSFANLGWAYSTQVADHLIVIADCFARTGDTSLYTYKTTEGAGGTEGGEKSLLVFIKGLMSFMLPTSKRYAGKDNDPACLIDGTQESNKWYSVADTWFAQANMFYKDPWITKVYTRNAEVGAKPYPANPNTTTGSDSQASPWAGGGSLYPGKLFMYGQLEGKINPYSTSSTPEPKPEPKPEPEPLTFRPADNPSKTLSGIEYSYYEGKWDKIPDFSKLKPVKTGTIANFDLSPKIKSDFFAFSFNGFIDVPEDAEYTFYINSDDGSALYIGDVLVVNYDGLHAAAAEKNGKIALKAGKHKITVHYLEYDGAESLSVSWSGGNIPKGFIPSNVLYRIDNTTTGTGTDVTKVVADVVSELEDVVTKLKALASK